MKQITLKEFWEKSNIRLLQGAKDYVNYTIDLDGDTSYVGMIVAREEGKLLWADDGKITVPINNCISYDQLAQMCKDITQNKASYCCRCGKKVVKRVQHWFAGRYCDKCWAKEII